MLSKVETSNLEDKYFDFFCLIQKAEFIRTPPYISSIKEIISSIILFNILDVELEGSMILVTVELKVKMVCATCDDNLHMIDDRFLFFRRIEVSKKVEGISIDSIFRDKRLEYETVVFGNQITILDNEKILLEVQGGIGISYKRGFSIAMLMRTSEFEKNIYMCFEDGRDIRQVTFEADTEYHLVKWVRGKNLISYVKRVFDDDFLCFYNIAENSECEILNFTNRIYEYTFIDGKKMVLDCEVGNQRGFYIYDLQNEEFYKMMRSIKSVELELPFYRADIDRIFFLKKEMDKFRLCSVKSDITNFEELCVFSSEKFFTKDEFSFVVCFEVESILLYDVECKKQVRVKYPLGNLANLKFHAISDKKNTFAVAMGLGDEILFYIFEGRAKKFKFIKCERKFCCIGGMCFNDRGSGLFISVEVLGGYNLYRLDLNGDLTEILALYSEELELFKR